jgi:hypothetical protein
MAGGPGFRGVMLNRNVWAVGRSNAVGTRVWGWDRRWLR